MLVTQAPCQKIYRAADSRVRPVELAVLHWTASPPKAPGLADEPRMLAWLADNDREQSTHLIILRDGRVIQAAGFDDRTWHAGGSVWTDLYGHPAGGVNFRSIGIDLENVGFLKKSPTGDGSFVDGYGGRYRGAPPVRLAGKGYFEPYTPAQLVALDAVVCWVAHEVPILRDPRRWTGHENIQKGKSDPGPLLPWEALRLAVSSAGKV